MKYLRNLNNHNAYEAFIIGSDFATIQSEQRAVVSYCKAEEHVHYNPYVPVPPIANLYDVLYSDANGNLSFTSEVLPVSEGKIPIAICVTEAGFFGTNEPARWMSLKYMSCNDPDSGSLSTDVNMMWGNNGLDIDTIDNIQITHAGGSNWGYLTSDWITGTDNKIPSLFDANNEWNISALGEVNKYGVTDKDGKNKTTKIIATVTTQPNWQTDTTITNGQAQHCAPAACCCWRYHTLGTQQGDWYLAACGELSMIVINKPRINAKLTAINTLYPNDCISTLASAHFLTSTEVSVNQVFRILADDGKIGYRGKYDQSLVFAIMQY